MNRFSTIFVSFALILGTAGVPSRSEAQSVSVNGPVLGFTPDRTGETIWPIIGVPGASSLGDAFELDTRIHGAVISPSQNYALAVRNEDRQVVLIGLTNGVVNTINGTHPGGDVIAISAAGSAAALYDLESGTVQLVGGLPLAATIIHEFDVSQIEGRVTGIAVNDNATATVVKLSVGDGTAMWVLTADRSSQLLIDHPSAAAFFPNRNDAVVSDDATHSVWMITDIGNTATQFPLIYADDPTSTFSAIIVGEDGGHVYLADGGKGMVTTVDVATGMLESNFCGCTPTGFYRLRGTSTFRLNEPSSGPVMVLDGSSSKARVVIVPSKPLEELQQ